MLFLVFFDFNFSEMWSSSGINNAAQSEIIIKA